MWRARGICQELEQAQATGVDEAERIGHGALGLKRAWHDGTRELVFEPLEFLERLAALTPRPETNPLICHGVLAPRARWRARVVVYGRVEAAYA